MSTVFSTEKKKGGSYVLTSTALTDLAALGATATVNDVLDILSTVVKDSHVVAQGQIGKASSTLV